MIPQRWLTFVCLAVSAHVAGFGPTSAQDREWKWPDQPKNLQVLPADFNGQRLRGVMLGFIEALGVGCAHCHVGEPGQPLTTYDFASDANPNKNRARAMYRMLGSINDQLSKIEPSGDRRVNMWCHTCHQGRPRPMTLQEELSEVYRTAGIEKVLSRYEKLRADYRDRGGYDFRERSLNALGYEILGLGDTQGAIQVFRLNARQFPESANVWDSLAEAYLKGGNTELSAIFYRKSLELDPENQNALGKLRELESSVK